jgi:hypothetical protein
MPRLDPQTVWKRLVEDKKLPCKARMEALQQIARPSVELLRRLLASKSTPSRLRLLAAQKYDLAIARKELLREA